MPDVQITDEMVERANRLFWQQNMRAALEDVLSSASGTTGDEMAPFAVGETVETIKGAKFWGEVASVYDLGPPRFEGEPSGWRCDVRAVAPDFAGTIHVYPATQLRRRTSPEPSGTTGSDRPPEGLARGQGGRADLLAGHQAHLDAWRAGEPHAPAHADVVEAREEIIARYSEGVQRNAREIAGMPLSVILQHHREFAGEIAALAAAETGRWRPIETAPKNGRHILLRVPRPGGLLYAIQGAFVEDGWQSAAWDDVRPTHWMPLPAAPLTEAGRR